MKKIKALLICMLLKFCYFCVRFGREARQWVQATIKFGGLAQLARALAWHARGHRFDSGILHTSPVMLNYRAFLFQKCTT
jgi:hypothetical protein